MRKTQNTLEGLQTNEDWFEVCKSSKQVYIQGFPISHTVFSTWKWFWWLLTHGLALWCAFPKLIECTLLPGVWHELIFAPRTSFCLSKTKRVHYCAFHKHANSKVQKPPSQLRFSLPSIIITITSNEPWNKETHKTDRNPTITDHKSWAFEPVKLNFCFLRGPPRWLTAAKIENVSWLLMSSPLSQEVTWPAAIRVLSRGKRRNPRSEIVE